MIMIINMLQAPKQMSTAQLPKPTMSLQMLPSYTTIKAHVLLLPTDSSSWSAQQWQLQAPAIGASSGYAPHRRSPRGPRTPSSWDAGKQKNTLVRVVSLECSRPYFGGYWLLVIAIAYLFGCCWCWWLFSVFLFSLFLLLVCCRRCCCCGCVNLTEHPSHMCRRYRHLCE